VLQHTLSHRFPLARTPLRANQSLHSASAMANGPSLHPSSVIPATVSIFKRTITLNLPLTCAPSGRHGWLRARACQSPSFAANPATTGGGGRACVRTQARSSLATTLQILRAHRLVISGPRDKTSNHASHCVRSLAAHELVCIRCPTSFTTALASVRCVIKGIPGLRSAQPAATRFLQHADYIAAVLSRQSPLDLLACRMSHRRHHLLARSTYQLPGTQHLSTRRMPLRAKREAGFACAPPIAIELTHTSDKISAAAAMSPYRLRRHHYNALHPSHLRRITVIST